tara:strand:+ start:697 stop:942 length:246 start_codon:yes stop_codon:yes gene_type:complete
MPNFKKEGRGFKMKGFTPFTKKDDDKSKKPKLTKETKLLQKKDESMLEFHDRLKKLGFNKQASEVKSKMDKAYETADWDKE